MLETIEFLSSDEMIIVYVILAVAFVLFLIVFLVDKNYHKRKKKLNTKELNKLVEQVEEQEEKLEPLVETIDNKENKEDKLVEKFDLSYDSEEVSTNVSESNDLELEYNDIELNKKEAIQELELLTQELEKSEEKDVLDINEVHTSFEEEQERTAIISIDEYLERTNQLNIMKDEEDNDTPISLETFDKMIKDELDKTVDEDDIKVIDEVEIKSDVRGKYIPSPVISPVYGIESSHLELENTADYDKFDKQVKSTDDFISTLKELRENKVV